MTDCQAFFYPYIVSVILSHPSSIMIFFFSLYWSKLLDYSWTHQMWRMVQFSKKKVLRKRRNSCVRNRMWWIALSKWEKRYILLLHCKFQIILKSVPPMICSRFKKNFHSFILLERFLLFYNLKYYVTKLVSKKFLSDSHWLSLYKFFFTCSRA